LTTWYLRRPSSTNNRVDYYKKSYRVIRESFMKGKDGAPKSFKQFGPQGYSDHFPITAKFMVRDAN